MERKQWWRPRGPTNCTERGASAQSTPGVEVIEVATGNSVVVITPKRSLQDQGREANRRCTTCQAKTTKLVDDFVEYRVVTGEKRLVRRRSYYYLRGIHCVPADHSDLNAMYHCLRDRKCHPARVQRTNVNEHHERHHLIRGNRLQNLTLRAPGIPVDKYSGIRGR